jgi:sec-independent protein translocase protein TatB
MFDFGFSKLLLLGIVALVVIGPERLPRVARTLGHLYGRLQRYVTQVKSDIHREMEAADLGKMKTEFESAARSFQSEVVSSVRAVETQARETQASIEKALDVQAPVANEAVAPAPPATTAAAQDAEQTAQLELGIEEPEAQGGSAKPAAVDRAYW